MTHLVIDSNKVFSALLSRKSSALASVMMPEFVLHAPNFLMAEMFKNKPKLLKNSKLEEAECDELLELILEEIHFYPFKSLKLANRAKAFELCADIDEKDSQFVALALELNCQFWTGDQKLKSGLRAKGVDIFYEP